MLRGKKKWKLLLDFLDATTNKLAQWQLLASSLQE